MQLFIGTMFILFTLLCSGAWIYSGRPFPPSAVILASVACGVGLLIVISERLTELRIANFGTFKAALKQVVIDAEVVTKIREQVEAQRSTIDLVAKSAQESKLLAESLQQKNAEASEQLASLKVKITDADRELKELESLSKFHTALLAAQSDSRAAFDQLYLWSVDSQSPFADLASQAYQVIMNDHSKSFFQGVDPGYWRNEMPDGTSVNLSEANLSELYKRLDSHVRSSFLSAVNEETKLTKNQKVRFLAEVLQSEPNLSNIEWAGRFFASQTGLQIKALALHYFLDWWQKNQGQYAS